MILAVDFDNTLMNTDTIPKGHVMGPPEPGAILAMKHLNEQGHTLIIFTGRNVQADNVRKAVQNWLEYFNIPFHGITNVKQAEFDIIIDDRALHFDNWVEVLKQIPSIKKGLSPHHEDDKPSLLTDISKPLDQQS